MDDQIWVNSPHIRIYGRSTERQGNLVRVEFMAVNEAQKVNAEGDSDTFVIAVGMGETGKLAYDRAIKRIEEDHGIHIAEQVKHVWKCFTV